MTVSIKFSDFMKDYAEDIAMQAKSLGTDVSGLYAIIDYTIGEGLWIVHFDTYVNCLEHCNKCVEQDPFYKEWLDIMSYYDLQEVANDVYVLMRV